MTRRSGQRRIVDLQMHLPSDWTLTRAAEVRSRVEQALMGAIPGLHATIQVLPSAAQAHFDDTQKV
jgi:divalent metal cation (Fe/Co/Zn/Cd) transporter